MRLLFLTSPDSVRGVTSDDGFIIGRFDLGDTLGLLALGGGIGVIGGLGYLAIRRWLPESRWQRSTLCAAGGATVVGSLIISDEGVDFTLLEPAWLAIALFVLIPTAFGALISVLVDRRDGPQSWFRRAKLQVALLPLLLLFPVLLLTPVLLAVVLLRWAGSRRPALLDLWESPQFLWAGRAMIGFIGAYASYELLQDITSIL